MSASVDSEPKEATETDRSLGVRFTESAAGGLVVGGLLFVTSSFWLTIATVGVLLVLIAWAMNTGVMSGIVGVFGLSGTFVGLLGYGTLKLYVRYQDWAGPESTGYRSNDG